MTIKAYLIQTGILALVFFAVFYSIRLYTFNEVRKQYNQTIERLELEQLQNLQQLQHEQNVIVTGYINDIERLKEQHEKDVKELENANFKDTVIIKPTVSECVCPADRSKTGVQAAGVKSDLVCYTRSELQRKVEESMGIAKEADELAIKYRALLDVCTQKDK